MTDQTAAAAPLSVRLLRVYVKDLSFENPRSPQIFRENWRPEISLEVAVQSRPLEDGVYEVILRLTTEAKKSEEEVGFICEVEQAGIFEVKAAEPALLERALKVFCPTTLFPYARQVIDQSLLLGSFPPILLAPVNFEQLARRDGEPAKN